MLKNNLNEESLTNQKQPLITKRNDGMNNKNELMQCTAYLFHGLLCIISHLLTCLWQYVN